MDGKLLCELMTGELVIISDDKENYEQRTASSSTFSPYQMQKSPENLGIFVARFRQFRRHVEFAADFHHAINTSTTT